MTKHLLSFVLALFALGCLTAQPNIEAVNPTTYVEGLPTDLITNGFDIKNNTNVPISVKVQRNVISEVEGSYNYFCWYQCYSPGTDLSPTGITINPGEAVSNFYADYQPNGINGSTIVEYCFFNESNPSDETCVTVEYYADGSLSVSNPSSKVILGEFQPNPAIESTKINFNLKQANDHARIVVYNILGSEVLSQNLSGNTGTARLDVSALETGVYIVSFNNANKVLTTKKLVVQ